MFDSKCKHCQSHHDAGHPKPEPPEIKHEVKYINEPIIWNEVPNFMDPLGFSGELVHTTADIRKIVDRALKQQEKKFLATLPSESAEPVVAYRVWRYKKGKLQSAFKDTIWPGYKVIARDLYEDEGIHGVKDYKRIPKLMHDYGTENIMFNYPASIMVAGAINMWGEIKEHEIGYLSEFAYPKELYVGPEFDPLKIMDLEENYGVPVTIREELDMNKIKEEQNRKAYASFFSPFTYTYGAFMPKSIGGSTP